MSDPTANPAPTSTKAPVTRLSGLIETWYLRARELAPGFEDANLHECAADLEAALVATPDDVQRVAVALWGTQTFNGVKETARTALRAMGFTLSSTAGGADEGRG